MGSQSFTGNQYPDYGGTATKKNRWDRVLDSIKVLNESIDIFKGKPDTVIVQEANESQPDNTGKYFFYSALVVGGLFVAYIFLKILKIID